MSRMRIALWTGLLIGSASPSHAGEYFGDLKNWMAIDPLPQEDINQFQVGINGWLSDRWLSWDFQDRFVWGVTLRDGQPRAYRFFPIRERTPEPLPFKIEEDAAPEEFAGSRISIRVSDGWMAAFSRGEFGAGLWWFSPDGRQHEKLAEAWVKSFVATETGLIAVEGLAHGFSSEGHLLRLRKGTDGRWKSEIFVDLEAAPDAAVNTIDGSLIVAAGDRLLRITPSPKKVEVLMDNVFWRHYGPDSIVVSDGAIYLGARFGVVKVVKKDEAYKACWLLPDKDFRMKPPGMADKKFINTLMLLNLREAEIGDFSR